MSDLISKPRVAVIDDEHIVADTLAEILMLHGYEAKAYYNGESALADTREFCPEVVLSDVCMEGIGGIETSVRIRASHPECRIILFTASPVRCEIHQRIDELGFEFLQRPLHPWDVLVLLRAEETNRTPGADRRTTDVPPVIVVTDAGLYINSKSRGADSHSS